MAVLVGEQLSREIRLTLEAWQPGCGRDDIDSYRVALVTDGQLTYEQVHTVAKRQSGHFGVYRISNAFRHCKLLAARTIGFNLHSHDEPIECDHEAASVQVDTDWLGFTFHAARRKRYRRDD